ncbi:MAG: protein kinase [Myxococcales bacterium]
MNRLANDQAGKVVLGRYRLVMPLAKGGQGMVYLARGEGAAGFTLPVVIKRVLTPIATDPESIERFVREARITAQLRHPDIVSILDFEQESDDSYVMVLEYVHGYDLAKWTRFVRADSRPFPADLGAYLTIRVLEALHHSHSLRAADGTPTPVIHRDVSPGNVLIDEDGHVKLTDFGIAHSKSDRNDEQSSGSGTKPGIQGKIAYISPELYRGGPPSAQSDLYACAVMLHQLLVGKNEFQAKDLVSTAMRVVQHVPTKVSELRPDVSPAAAAVIARALAKDPSQRHQSARELSVDLRRAFQLDLGEMPEKLLRAVRQDFFDPRFPKLAEVLDLATIDRAWREVPAARPLSNFPPSTASASGAALKPVAPAASAGLELSTTLAEVDADALPKDSAQAAPKRSESLPWMLAAAVAVAAAIAFVVTRQSGRENRVVFVDARENAGPSEPAAAAEGPTETASAKPPTPPPIVAPAKETPATKPSGETKARADDDVQGLTRAFGARRKEVEACFTQHSAALEGAPRVQVDFEISAKGVVTGAGLDPSAIENTELGRCILKVASATRFPKQAGTLRFRIPLTARGQ